MWGVQALGFWPWSWGFSQVEAWLGFGIRIWSFFLGFECEALFHRGVLVPSIMTLRRMASPSRGSVFVAPLEQDQ